MKIEIKDNEKNFTIKMPLWFIKTKLFKKYIDKSDTYLKNYNKKKLKILYKSLKKYISNNGHFMLLEINSGSSLIKIKL